MSDGGPTSAEELLEQRKSRSGGVSGISSYAVGAIFGGIAGYLVSYVFLSIVELWMLVYTDAMFGLVGTLPQLVRGLVVIGFAVSGIYLAQKRSNEYLIYPLSMAIVARVGYMGVMFLWYEIATVDSTAAEKAWPVTFSAVTILAVVALFRWWDGVYHDWLVERVSGVPDGGRLVEAYLSRNGGMACAVGAVASTVLFRVLV